MEQEQQFIPQPIQEERPKRSKKLLIGFFTSLVLLAVLAGVVWLVSLERAASAPLRTSDAFIQGLLDNNVDKAYAVTGKDFRDKTSKEDLAIVAESASKGLDRESLKVSKGDIEDVERGKFATVYYEIKGKDTTYNLTIRLLKEKGQGWFVVSADNEAKD